MVQFFEYHPFQVYPVYPKLFFQGLSRVLGGLILYSHHVSILAIFGFLVLRSQYAHMYTAPLTLMIVALDRNINKIVGVAVLEISA